MDLEFIRECARKRNITRRIHALEKLVSRKFTRENVIDVLLKGEVIESYLDDKPYPSLLLCGKTRNNRITHAVCSLDRENYGIFIVTVYEPDPKQWTSDFKKRK